MTSGDATPYPTSTVPGGRFPTTRWLEGYDIEQVDAFCERGQRALTESSPGLGPAEVRSARFRPVRMRTGYEMGPVDSYLDELAAQLAAQLAARHGDPATTGDPAAGSAGGHCPGCRCAELGLTD
jgi:DivIVA domain-containing protein